MATKKNSSNQNKVSRFQESCPLKLKRLPEGICEHGLTRARWTADHAGYLAFEEKQARGCPFGLLTEDKHSYCFFKLMADIEHPLSEEQVARMTCLSKEQVRKIVESASHKLRRNSDIQDLKKLHQEGGLFEEPFSEEDIFFPDDFSAELVQQDGVVEETSTIPKKT